MRAAWPGRHTPLGATWDGEGTNFSLFSEHGEWAELVLFDTAGKASASYELAEYTDLCWHGYVHGVGPGQRYDVIWPARESGKWIFHCHIPHHTLNNNVEERGAGGLTLLVDVAP